jgi:hypothetical protein
LRARPEATQLEDLSDASFMGKLLVLQQMLDLTGKFLPGANTLAYLALSSAMKKNSFITLTPVRRSIKHFRAL